MNVLKSLLCALVAILAGTTGALAFRVDTIAVSGPGLAAPMPALVIVPDAATAENRVPTVYLLHGYGGEYDNWYSHQPRIGELADRYGMIVVTPGVGNTWYFDAPGKPDQQVETFFTGTLVPYIDANYPTLAVREKRAITGLSMGGHGSLYMAGRHPELFGAAGSMSGGLDIRPFPNNWKIKDILGPQDTNRQAWEENTVATMIPQLKAADLAIIVDCGADDFFAEVNARLHDDMLAAGVAHDYYSRPGNHSWKYWNNAVLYHLLYFNEFFNRQ